MKERLIQFITYLKISHLKFETNVGFSRGFVANFSGNITVKSLLKIEVCYPELDILWLITGRGKMLKNGNNDNKVSITANIKGKNHHHNIVGCNDGDQIINNQSEHIKLLEQTIAAQAKVIKLYEAKNVVNKRTNKK